MSRRAVVVVALVAGVPLVLTSLERDGRGYVQGRVVGPMGPIAGAEVGFQGRGVAALSDAWGVFRLPAPNFRRPITAWKSGHAIGAGLSAAKIVTILLDPLPTQDNPDYAWIAPGAETADARSCVRCHRQIFDEWSHSGHARAATNKRFVSLVAGVDWHGEDSRSWSLKHEHPLGMGVCARCHAPTYRDPTLTYDPAKITGVAAAGVHCDFCHKITDLDVDQPGLTFGADAYRILRPAGDEQLFFGPLKDAFRQGEKFAYAPVYRHSRYCAGCHEGVLFGVHVYGTYSEWQASPARRRGRHCQDCHMAPTGAMTNIAPGHGGVERDPNTLASHAMPGATRPMLQKCLSADVRIKELGRLIEVTITVAARNVGHRVPTGFIDRHLVLRIDATKASGERVAASEGPRIPSFALGAEPPAAGYVYAKRVVDYAGRSPAPFWLPVRNVVDTRLFPERPHITQYRFPATVDRLRVRLIHRRFWPAVAQSKAWPRDDLTLLDRHFEVRDRRDLGRGEARADVRSGREGR